jgi:hypothetical protein
MPLPPLECQNKFARCIAAMNKVRSKLRVSTTKLDSLFESLQYQAFRENCNR